MIFFSPIIIIVNCIEKNPCIINLHHYEHSLPVCWHLVISGFKCINIKLLKCEMDRCEYNTKNQWSELPSWYFDAVKYFQITKTFCHLGNICKKTDHLKWVMCLVYRSGDFVTMILLGTVSCGYCYQFLDLPQCKDLCRFFLY